MTTYNVKLTLVCRECLKPLDAYQRDGEVLVEPCSLCMDTSFIEGMNKGFRRTILEMQEQEDK
jgi:hypothetical protein